MAYTVTLMDAEGGVIAQAAEYFNFLGVSKGWARQMVSDAEYIKAGAYKAEVTDDKSICVFDIKVDA